jgi:hypothetical protein
VDGLSEVEHQHAFLWDVVVVDEEDTHHVSLLLTSTWAVVLVSNTTMSIMTSNFWMVIITYTTGELGVKWGGSAYKGVGMTTVSDTEWSMT